MLIYLFIFKTNSHEQLVKSLLFDKYQELISQQINTGEQDIYDNRSLQNNNKYLQYKINENTIQNLIKEDFKDLFNDFKKDKKDPNLSDKISIYKVELLKIIDEHNQKTSDDQVDRSLLSSEAFSKAARVIIIKSIKFAVNKARKYLNTLSYLENGN